MVHNYPEMFKNPIGMTLAIGVTLLLGMQYLQSAKVYAAPSCAERVDSGTSNFLCCN